MTIQEKTVSQSQVETFHIVRPNDLNPAGRLFGGTLMSWIDEVAALVARRHAQMNVTTGSVDNLKFLSAVYLEEMLVMKGKVTHVGTCSMEIKVETFVEHINGQRDLVNVAYFTLIGLDDTDKPAPLPKLKLETEEDRIEWEKANKRRELRRKQAQEGFHFY